MPPARTQVPPRAVPVYEAYLAWLAARGVGGLFRVGARRRSLLAGLCLWLARIAENLSRGGTSTGRGRPRGDPLYHRPLRPRAGRGDRQRLWVAAAGGGARPASAGVVAALSGHDGSGTHHHHDDNALFSSIGSPESPDTHPGPPFFRHRPLAALCQATGVLFLTTGGLHCFQKCYDITLHSLLRSL